jgi:aspartate/methionine/tyrosine aminotransferase
MANWRARRHSGRVFSERSALDRRPNALERARLERSAEGSAVVDLTESNPTTLDAGLPRFEAAFAALRAVDPSHYDPEPFGLPSARAAVSRFMGARGCPVAAERVVLTASTSEAYGLLFKVLCDPGDEVLVPAPSYPLLDHLARFDHVRLVPYRLRYDGRWHLPQDALAGLVGPRTRAVITVSPNNPTGSFLKRGELRALAALGLPVVSDEVFAAYALAPEDDAVPSAALAEQVAVLTLHGLSKLAARPQLTLGWTCASGPAARVDELLVRLAVVADSQLSVATPIQLALPAILDGLPTITDAVLSRVRENLAAVRGALEGSAISALHAEGGWYAILRLPALMSDECWAVALLREAGVLVQPGYFFDLDQGPYVVLSLIVRPDVLGSGLAALRAHVERVAAQGAQVER